MLISFLLSCPIWKLFLFLDIYSLSSSTRKLLVEKFTLNKGGRFFGLLLFNSFKFVLPLVSIFSNNSFVLSLFVLMIDLFIKRIFEEYFLIKSKEVSSLLFGDWLLLYNFITFNIFNILKNKFVFFNFLIYLIF